MNTHATGYNNINVDEVTERGIRVTNTSGVLIDTMADFAFMLTTAIA